VRGSGSALRFFLGISDSRAHTVLLSDVRLTAERLIPSDRTAVLRPIAERAHAAGAVRAGLLAVARRFFVLPDADFAGRQNGGGDFRLEANGDAVRILSVQVEKP